jgi:hypothetical protein
MALLQELKAILDIVGADLKATLSWSDKRFLGQGLPKFRQEHGTYH